MRDAVGFEGSHTFRKMREKDGARNGSGDEWKGTVEFVRSHPSRKNNDAARVGHPGIVS